ncbi:MAG: YdcH family protein [Pseudomonadota bacterium]
MGNTPHELVAEFPEHAEKISQLKLSDTHFIKLFDDYHAVNRSVHRAETNVEPMGDVAQIELRKERAALKDEIYRFLTS